MDDSSSPNTQPGKKAKLKKIAHEMEQTKIQKQNIKTLILRYQKMVKSQKQQ